MDDLRAALDRILAQLTRLGAPVAKQLRPGLPDHEIAEMLRDLPFTPPQELRALSAWRNGTTGQNYFFPSHNFLSLEEAIADYHGRREVANEFASDDLSADDLWDPRWFPIFRASYGTEYAMLCPERETDTAPMLYVDVEGGAHDVQYTSLTHMLRVLADSYEAGAITRHPDGYLVEDEATVGAIRRAYSPTRADVALEALRQRATGSALTQAINDVIELHDTRAVEPLLALLREGDTATKHAVILPLGILGDEQVVPPLLALVAAGRQMRGLGGNSPLAYAWHLMNERARMDSFTRVQAMDALERIVERTRQPLPLEPFLAAMDDPEPMAPMRAARRLGASGDARALPALLAALGHHDMRARRAAIEALGQLGDARALAPLRKIVQSPDSDWQPNLRAVAAAAIARIEAHTA